MGDAAGRGKRDGGDDRAGVPAAAGRRSVRLPRGVTGPNPLNPRRPYQARLQYQGKRYSIGYFESPEDAEQARQQFREELRTAPGEGAAA